MSRALLVALPEGDVVSRCLAEKGGISDVERLPGGGVRLVCMSGDGAAIMTRKLKAHLIAGDVKRALRRPSNPLW